MTKDMYICINYLIRLNSLLRKICRFTIKQIHLKQYHKLANICQIRSFGSFMIVMQRYGRTDGSKYSIEQDIYIYI